MKKLLGFDKTCISTKCFKASQIKKRKEKKSEKLEIGKKLDVS